MSLKKGFRKIREIITDKLAGWDLQQSTSAQKLANLNALNRRKNTRIKYPHIGAVADLPKVYYRGDEMIVSNISTGGLLLIDDTGVLGTAVGTEIDLELRWAADTVKTRARIVAAQLQRRHIQFIDFNATAFVRISNLIRPGFLGSKFHLVSDPDHMLEAKELWVGPTGESVTFVLDKSSMAEVSLAGQCVLVSKNRYPTWKQTDERVSRATVAELLVVLSNMPNITSNVKLLIETLQIHYIDKTHAAYSTLTGTDD